MAVEEPVVILEIVAEGGEVEVVRGVAMAAVMMLKVPYWRTVLQ